jgi:hypothetical protein
MPSHHSKIVGDDDLALEILRRGRAPGACTAALAGVCWASAGAAVAPSAGAAARLAMKPRRENPDEALVDEALVIEISSSLKILPRVRREP